MQVQPDNMQSRLLAESVTLPPSNRSFEKYFRACQILSTPA
jgi:hypothetical protein